jgi:hypothetical protein
MSLFISRTMSGEISVHRTVSAKASVLQNANVDTLAIARTLLVLCLISLFPW